MGVRGVEVVRSRRGPHAYPTMGTASGCGTTVWGFRRGAERRREGCDGGGDRPYVERVRSRRGPHAYPTMGTASGCGTTVWGFGLGREGCDGGGDRPYVERVRSRRGPHAYPTMDTASGCGTTVWGFRLGGRKDGGRGVTAVGTALTSSGFVAEGVPTRALGYRIGVRYDGLGVPAWGAERRREGCDGGGDRPYVERVRSRRGPHAGPTMGTASGCGTTREGWVPDRGAI